MGGVPQECGTDQDVVRAKLPELLSQYWDFGNAQVEGPRCPGQGLFHGSDKLCREQRADAALHGRAMLLMAVVATPDGVEEVGSDDLLEFRRRVEVSKEGGVHQELRSGGQSAPPAWSSSITAWFHQSSHC